MTEIKRIADQHYPYQQSLINMFEPIELLSADAAIWRSITDEQKHVLTILARNYDECYTQDDNCFPDAVNIDDIDAATYTSINQYVTWRSITQEQKRVILFVWASFVERYYDELARLYEENQFERMDVSFNMFTVYSMIENQDRYSKIEEFKFLKN